MNLSTALIGQRMGSGHLLTNGPTDHTCDAPTGDGLNDGAVWECDCRTAWILRTATTPGLLGPVLAAEWHALEQHEAAVIVEAQRRGIRRHG
jgi:hypothetical protein